MPVGQPSEYAREKHQNGIIFEIYSSASCIFRASSPLGNAGSGNAALPATNYNRLSSTSDSGSVCGLNSSDPPAAAAVAGVRLKISDPDKAVIEEMRACASELEDLDFDDDDDDSVSGHRRRNTDSK